LYRILVTLKNLSYTFGIIPGREKIVPGPEKIFPGFRIKMVGGFFFIKVCKKNPGPGFFPHGLKIIFPGKNKTSGVKNKLSRALKKDSEHEKNFPGKFNVSRQGRD
jgi:hypothetical protein